jgi:hypothetical protein
MVVIIKKNASKKEIEKAFLELRQQHNKTGLDLRKYMSVLSLKDNPVELQKKWRNDWI